MSIKIFTCITTHNISNNPHRLRIPEIDKASLFAPRSEFSVTLTRDSFDQDSSMSRSQLSLCDSVTSSASSDYLPPIEHFRKASQIGGTVNGACPQPKKRASIQKAFTRRLTRNFSSLHQRLNKRLFINTVCSLLKSSVIRIQSIYFGSKNNDSNNN